MPSGMINIDAHFPSFTGEESAREQAQELLSYLQMLTEQLRYTLKNLGAENFNESSLTKLQDDTTAGVEALIVALTARVSAIETAQQSQGNRISTVEGTITGTLSPGLTALQGAVQVDANGDITIGGAAKSVELTGTVSTNGTVISVP